jgi:dynein heavy chain 2
MLIAEPQWRGAVLQFENSLVPAENRIAGKLKAQLRNMSANTLQLLQEFKRYQELIKRPSIQRELIAEREDLLGKLSEFIAKERKGFRDVGASRRLHGIPITVNNIYFVRQLEAKVNDIAKTGTYRIFLDLAAYAYRLCEQTELGKLLLSDLSTWESLKATLQDFLDEMTEYQREQFDSWSRDNIQDIESRRLALNTSSQVVFFEAGKNMKVLTSLKG